MDVVNHRLASSQVDPLVSSDTLEQSLRLNFDVAGEKPLPLLRRKPDMIQPRLPVKAAQ